MFVGTFSLFSPCYLSCMDIVPTDDKRDMVIFQSQFYILKLRKCVKTTQQNNSQLFYHK